MRNILVALAVALAVGPAAASDKSEKTDVMAEVHQFIDNLHKGDTKTAIAACADQSSIVDEFPPRHWQSASTCADWPSDFDAFNKKNGVTDPIATLGKSRHVDITGDRAYVVVPATHTYKQNGKQVTEPGAVLTVALRGRCPAELGAPPRAQPHTPRSSTARSVS
jgi:hypothetical protein